MAGKKTRLQTTDIAMVTTTSAPNLKRNTILAKNSILPASNVEVAPATTEIPT